MSAQHFSSDGWFAQKSFPVYHRNLAELWQIRRVKYYLQIGPLGGNHEH
jgi:hypothetical protein